MKAQRQGFKLFRIILNKGTAVLVSGAALLFQACENNLEQIKAFETTENLPVMEAENFETTFTDSGQVRFFLKSPKLRRFETDEKPFVEFPVGLELVRYDQNKRIISSIKARYARQYLNEKKWEAKNDVVAVNMSGDTLKTELLIWDENTGKIYSDKFVRIIRPDQIINGIGFESDQSLQNWRIKNPTGIIYVSLKEENTEEQPEESNGEKTRPEPIKIK